MLAAFVMFGGVCSSCRPRGAGPEMTAGMIWGMVGSVSYAVMSLLNRKFVSRYEGSVVAFYEQGTAALLMLPILLFERPQAAALDWALLVILASC